MTHIALAHVLIRHICMPAYRGRSADSVVVHQYRHAFSGFAARLSEAEAAALRRKPGVVSVFADPVYHLHTTRSWDFLQQTTTTTTTTTTAVNINNSAGPSRRSSNKNKGGGPKAAAPADGPSLATADTIIGLLDSGIWPESPSFNDAGFGPVPSRWKGVCMTGDDFNSSNCNKLITDLAPFFPFSDFPRRCIISCF